MNADRQQPKSDRRDEETAFVEARKVIMSGALLLLSIVAFLLYTARALSTEVAAEFIAVFALVLVLVVLPRLFSFRGQVRQLLAVGTSKRLAGSRRRQIGKAVATAVSFILLLTAPLLLTRVVDPITWIVVVTGFISGYAASDMFFAGYASLWQRRSGIVLSRYRLWAVGSDEKRVLLESGIRRSNK